MNEPIINNKIKLYNYVFYTLIILLLIFAVIKLSHYNKNLNKKIDDLQRIINEHDKQIQTLSSLRIQKFNTTFVAFKRYNKTIDTAIVSQFLKTTKVFKLDTSNYMYELMISQICYETGAKHLLDNKIITGGHGEKGISQILPRTAFYTLKNLTKSEKDIMLNKLCCSDFDFVYSDDYNKSKNKMIAWLSNLINNLALWGHIMNSYICETGNYLKALHIYNVGHGNHMAFIRARLNLKSHTYISNILKIRSKNFK